MRPSDKSPALTEFLEKNFGRTSAIESLFCIPAPIGCGRKIEPGEVETWDMVTRKEYTISGWCKTCQAEIFGEE